jgi:hypothetical protein
MTDNICSHFVRSSNEFAADKEMRGYSEMTVAFLRVWFGLVLFMGVVQVPDRRTAFSYKSSFGQPFLYTLMSAKRFEDAASALHWLNTAAISAADQTICKRQDLFWQVNTLMTEIATNFRSYWSLGQDIDIDEMCVGFKGRHIARVLILVVKYLLSKYVVAKIIM